MAYVLGFFFADGHVYKNPRGSWYFCFVSTDKELIKNIKNLLNSEHKIGTRNRRENRKISYRLQIGSKNVCDYLNKEFRLQQNKSKIIKFPSNIPKECFRHFVRGYFDGDGAVYLKQHWRKNRNKKEWVFKTLFTSGNKDFLEKLHQNLKNEEIVHGGFIQNKKRSYDLVFSRRDSWGLYKLMYHNVTSDMYLSRKYKTFNLAKKKLNKRV